MLRIPQNLVEIGGTVRQSRIVDRVSSPRLMYKKLNKARTSYTTVVVLLTLSYIVKATAIYSYEGSNADELSFIEGDDLTIVDQLEVDWWRAERDGLVYVIPAAYVKVAEG